MGPVLMIDSEQIMIFLSVYQVIYQKSYCAILSNEIKYKIIFLYYYYFNSWYYNIITTIIKPFISKQFPVKL